MNYNLKRIAHKLLFPVNIFFLYFIFAGSSFASSIVVDESVIRGSDEHNGLQALAIAAFTQGCGSKDNILPLPFLDENGNSKDEDFWVFPVVFDTGCNNPAFLNRYGSYSTPGVSIGINTAQNSLLIPIETYADNQDVVGDEYTCLNLFLNGFNAIDPETFSYTGVPQAGHVATIRPGINRLQDEGVTLICMPVIKRIQALIDSRQEQALPHFTGPKVVFDPPEDEIKSGATRVNLALYRLLDDFNHTVDRWQMIPIIFRENNHVIENQHQYLFDTGSTYSAISRLMAQQLHLFSRPRDFTCSIDGNTYSGYVIDEIEMKGFVGDRQNLQDEYIVKNAHICVEDDDDLTTKIIKNSENGSIGDFQAVIGMNLFQQVRMLLDGPKNTLTILTDQGDFDGNLCVDQNDHYLLSSELNKIGQPVQIEGFVEIGTDSYFSGTGGEGYTVNYNFTSVFFTSNGPVEIVSIAFNFEGNDVIIHPDGDDTGLLDCGTSFQREPQPLIGDTQRFGVTMRGFGADQQCIVSWDIDTLSDGENPLREDYYNGSVLITFSDGSTTVANINEADSSTYARNSRSAAAAFMLTIPDFREPPTSYYDVNGDNRVDESDLEALTNFFSKPGGVPCSDTIEVQPGDIDGDGQVATTEDVIAFRAAFGSQNGDTSFNANADLDGNGRVNVDDLKLFRQFLQNG